MHVCVYLCGFECLVLSRFPPSPPPKQTFNNCFQGFVLIMIKLMLRTTFMMENRYLSCKKKSKNLLKNIISLDQKWWLHVAKVSSKIFECAWAQILHLHDAIINVWLFLLTCWILLRKEWNRKYIQCSHWNEVTLWRWGHEESLFLF